jgi:hypothetical protein
MKITENIPAILSIADVDYLSARLLFISGLPIAGMGKAAEALEKLFKISIAIITKINSQVDLTDNDFKKYGHNLNKLLDEYNRICPKEIQLVGNTGILTDLGKAYTARYVPKTDMQIGFSLEYFDHWFIYLRNNIATNVPKEIMKDVMNFGNSFGDLLETENFLQAISKYGAILPGDIIRIENKYFEKLIVDHECPMIKARKR